MTQPYRHSVSVAGVVVRNDGKILVIRRADNSQIQAPGGILEQEEDIHAGLVREVEEETGYRVRPQRLTGVYKNMTLGVVALVYRCELIDGSATPNSEAKEILWLDRDEIEGTAVEAFAVRVADALDMEWPATRSHDGTRLMS